MTELYRYDKDRIEAQRAELREAARPASLLERICASTYARIKADRLNYLEFGPYWWAVKRVLNANGYQLGVSDDAYMAGLYGAWDETPEITLICAWLAADEIRGSYFKGSRDITINHDVENGVYSLFDADIEGR